VHSEARAQWRGKPLTGDIDLSVTLYFGTKRKADWDNFHKLWADALNGIRTRTTAKSNEQRSRWPMTKQSRASNSL
jgi:Holliday junction resolvase RusA-like endonuclease